MNMQGLTVVCFLILGFASSPSLCVRWNAGIKNTFNVMDYGAHGDGISDDTQAFLSAWRETCGAAINGAATMIIPNGKAFLLKTITLNGPCKAQSIHIELQGNIVAPTMNAWGSDRPHWMYIGYVNNLAVDGGGQINGQGSLWWQNCRSCQRPSALFFHSCNNLTVNTLSFIDSPGGNIGINGCNGAIFSHLNIHAPPRSPNTDGIDISLSKNIHIEHSNIGTGDDCIAINGGCSYINVTGIACGPGHGISIGSLGKNGANETVEEVYVRNCTFNGTQNGARIKTFEGGSGYARKITFDDVHLIQTHFPIVIDQHYFSNGSDKGSAVKVSEVTYRGFRGTSSDDVAINLNCSSFGCYNIVLDQINIVSSMKGKKARAFCSNAHGTATTTTPKVSCLLH